MNKEESFSNLVSFKINYQHRTQSDLRREFKEMFALNNENNEAFIDQCSYEELIDLCMCFERYMAIYPNFSFSDLGVARYTSSNKKYFLFTTTDYIRNNETYQITGIKDEASMLFQIRDFSDATNRVRCYFNYTVIGKLGRLNEDEEPATITGFMLNSMNDEKNISGEEGTIIICKSKLRILFAQYKHINVLLSKAYERFVKGEQSEETRKLIIGLENRKMELQVQLNNMVHEIDEKYGNPNYDGVSYRERVEEEAEQFLGENTKVWKGSSSKREPKEPCSDEQNRIAQENREKINLR